MIWLFRRESAEATDEKAPLRRARARARERTTGTVETEIGNKTKLSYARRDRIRPVNRARPHAASYLRENYALNRAVPMLSERAAR